MMGRFLIGWMGILFLVLPALSQTPERVDAKRVEELVQQLGSSIFAVREKAHKELEAIGQPALEALLKAAQSEDLEVRRRAGDLSRKLQDKLAVSEILAPKKVTLQLKDVPVQDALNQLSKKTGYSLNIQGDRKVLADKKVTLNLKDSPFWEALDQICAQAGLVDVAVSGSSSVPPASGRPTPLPIRKLPVQVKPLPAPAPAPAPNLKKAGALNLQPIALKDEEAPPAPAPAQVQVQQLQLQVQVQPLPAQVFPAAPEAPGKSKPGEITLTPGNPDKILTSYHGATRIRLLPLEMAKSAPRSPDTITLVLDVAGEPRFEGFQLIGNPTVDKAVDNHGQELMMSTLFQIGEGVNQFRQQALIRVPYQTTHQRQTYLHLQVGKKKSEVLTELRGSVTAQFTLPEKKLFEITKVMESVGKPVKGKDGGALEVKSIEKQANGDYKVHYFLQRPNNGPFAGNVVIMGAGQVIIQGGGIISTSGMNKDIPTLLDQDGRKFTVASIPSRRGTNNNGAISYEVTVLYRGKDLGTPESFVLQGYRTQNLTLPFAFQNVPVGN